MQCMFNLIGLIPKARVIAQKQMSRAIDPCQLGFRHQLPKRDQTPKAAIVQKIPTKPEKKKIHKSKPTLIKPLKLKLPVTGTATQQIVQAVSNTIQTNLNNATINSILQPQVALVRNNIPRLPKVSTEPQSIIDPMPIPHQEEEIMSIEEMMPSPLPKIISPMSATLEDLFG